MNTLGILRVYAVTNFTVNKKNVERRVLLLTVHAVSAEDCPKYIQEMRSENQGEVIIGQFSVGFY